MSNFMVRFPKTGKADLITGIAASEGVPQYAKDCLTSLITSMVPDGQQASLNVLGTDLNGAAAKFTIVVDGVGP